MVPIHYGWIAGGILFLVAIVVNPWLCVPYALMGPGYAMLIQYSDDGKGGRLGYPAHRWWFRRLSFADVTSEQIGVMCSLICFVIGVFSNSWLSIPYAIGGLLLGMLLGGMYSVLRWIVRKL